MKKKPAKVCTAISVIDVEKVEGQLSDLAACGVRSNHISRHYFLAVGERQLLVCRGSCRGFI